MSIIFILLTESRSGTKERCGFEMLSRGGAVLQKLVNQAIH
jgi:hypothetical protein